MISIRRARTADAAALAALWPQVDRLHARLQPRFFGPGPRAAPRGQPAGMDGAVFVAEQVGSAAGAEVASATRRATIVGAVRVRVYDSPSDPLIVPRRRGYVEEIVIDEAHRREGLGRRLMQRAEDWCRAQGARDLLLTVWTGNEEAEAFYERLGYEAVNRVLCRELD